MAATAAAAAVSALLFLFKNAWPSRTRKSSMTRGVADVADNGKSKRQKRKIFPEQMGSRYCAAAAAAAAAGGQVNGSSESRSLTRALMLR